jgi:hypothetical protein
MGTAVKGPGSTFTSGPVEPSNGGGEPTPATGGTTGSVEPPRDGVDAAGHDPNSGLFDPAPRAGTGGPGGKSGYTQAQADRDAKALYDATEGGLTGWGTNEDAIFRTLQGKSKSEIDLIRESYRDHYGRDLDPVLRGEVGGDDRRWLDQLLQGTSKKSPEEVSPPFRPHGDDAARLEEAMDGVGTDESAIRDVLGNKSKADIDDLARVYKQRYGEDLRSRLQGELGGRDELELVDQLFDRGKIDPRDPNANAERLRRLREQQDLESGAGGWVTDKVQRGLKGESDQQRLERNIARAEQASSAGDQARAARLLGHAQGDLDSFKTAKDSAADAAATGAAVVASTAVVVGTAGAATPLVVAGAAALAGGTASAGAYAVVQGGAADAADLGRQGLIGAAAGATAVVGAPLSVAGRAAVGAAGRQAAVEAGEQVAGGVVRGIVQGAREGARAGAAGGAADGAVRTATERGTWEDGLARGAFRVVGGTVEGAATGALVGAGTGAAVGAAKHARAGRVAPEGPAAPTPREIKAAMTPAEREAHYRSLGSDPATGGRYRANEAATADRLEDARGISLERYQPALDQKGDWFDVATGQVYDGCSPPPTAHFDRQLVAGGPYEASLREHLAHPTVDRVVVDVSGLGLTAAQLQALDDLIARVAGPNSPKIVRLP